VIPGRNVPGIAQKNPVVRHHTLRIRGTLSFYWFYFIGVAARTGIYWTRCLLAGGQ
jgi:hypothetical protein